MYQLNFQLPKYIADLISVDTYSISCNWDCASSYACGHCNTWRATATTQTRAAHLEGWICRDEGNAPRCLAHGRPLLLLLQVKPPQTWRLDYWHPPVGGRLCLAGGCPIYQTSLKDHPIYGLPAYYWARKQEFWRGSLGLLWCCLQTPAAAISSLDWAIVDSALYSEAFTGWARTLPHCRYCLSDTHSSHECLYAPAETSAPMPKVPRGAANSGGFRHPRPPGSSADAVELCGLFNRPGATNAIIVTAGMPTFAQSAHGPSPSSRVWQAQHIQAPPRTSASSLSPRRGTRRPSPPQQWQPPLVAQATVIDAPTSVVASFTKC